MERGKIAMPLKQPVRWQATLAVWTYLVCVLLCVSVIYVRRGLCTYARVCCCVSVFVYVEVCWCVSVFVYVDVCWCVLVFVYVDVFWCVSVCVRRCVLVCVSVCVRTSVMVSVSAHIIRFPAILSSHGKWEIPVVIVEENVFVWVLWQLGTTCIFSSADLTY